QIFEAAGPISAEEQCPGEINSVRTDAVNEIVLFGDGEAACEDRHCGLDVPSHDVHVAEESVCDGEAGRVLDVRRHSERLVRGREGGVEVTEGGVGLRAPPAQADVDRIDETRLLAALLNSLE